MSVDDMPALIVECQTTQRSWLRHVKWAYEWRELTGLPWGCEVCGTRTFHAANVARAEKLNATLGEADA